MIVIATLVDEDREGQRRAMGRTVRYQAVLGVDKFNLVLAERVGPGNFIGKKFVARMNSMPPALKELEIDPKVAQPIINKSLAEIFGKNELNLTWKQMDKVFHPSLRADDSTGELELYRLLKQQRGDTEEADNEEPETA